MTHILLDLIDLSETSPNRRRYNADVTILALKLFLISKSCYKMMRTYFPLPTSETLMKSIGSFNNIGSEVEAANICKIFFSVDSSKKCGVLVDEVKILPSLRLRGGHVLGKAADDTKKIARSVLAIMVKPLLSKARAFVIRLVPVFSLNGSFLKELVTKALLIISNAGGSSLYVMSDNHASNRTFHTLLKEDYESSEAFCINHPVEANKILYLLFDPVHILKCIRNNWITLPSQMIQFCPPGENTTVSARWSDVVEVYEKEKKSALRRTRLTAVALNPSAFEKQKVSLVLKVFDDKTIAALIQDGYHAVADL